MSVRRFYDKFVTAQKLRAGYFEVYENPTTKELETVTEDGHIRFIADSKTKKVYVFPVSFLHAMAFDALGLPSDMEERSRFVTGIAAQEGSSREWHVVATFSVSMAVKFGEYDVLKKDWAWTKQYVKGIPEVIQYEIKLRKLKF